MENGSKLTFRVIVGALTVVFVLILTWMFNLSSDISTRTTNAETSKMQLTLAENTVLTKEIMRRLEPLETKDPTSDEVLRRLSNIEAAVGRLSALEQLMGRLEERLKRQEARGKSLGQ